MTITPSLSLGALKCHISKNIIAAILATGETKARELTWLLLLIQLAHGRESISPDGPI